MENRDKLQKKWIQTGCLFLLVACVLIAGPIKGNAQETNHTESERYSALLNQQKISGNSVSKEGNLVSFTFRNLDLSEALKMLAEELSVGLAFDAGLTLNKKVTLRLHEVTAYEALDSILAGTGLKAVIPESREVIFIKNSEEKASLPVEIITGTVTDANTGETLPGVNVMIKGTTTGTSADAEGTYELDVPSLQDTLVVSFVGYQTREVPINGRTEIDISLTPETIAGDEVVVVGYGEQQRTTLTGSISSVQSEDVESISTSNVATGLAGKLPGVRVTQRTGEPGSYTTEYDIRGFGNPLIVIDGVVRDNSSFVRLDPNDIESINVLKDASAAVYGVKAANGVIVIETKKGGRGAPEISYTANYQVQQVTNAPVGDEVGNAYEYAVLTTENEINAGIDPNQTTYSQEDLQKFKDGTYPSTDWYEVVANTYAPMQRHNLNVSGGSENIRYFTSLGFLDEEGLWKSGDLNYSKYNIRSNVTGYIGDNLTAELSVDGTWENKNETSEPAWNVFKFTWMNKPTLPVYANDNPEYLQYMNYAWHPLAMTEADITGYQKTKTKYFQGDLTLNYDFPLVYGLSAKVQASYFTENTWRRRWRKKYEMYEYNEQTDVYEVRGTRFDPSTLYGYYNPMERMSLMGQLTYENDFLGDHHVKGTLVFEERQVQYEDVSAEKQFDIDIDQFYAGNSANQQINSNGITEQANQNVIGRLNYDYKSKYLLETGFNYGGSSLFPESNRWGFFPFVSLGWRLSEESFMEDNMPAITDLKVRASWGEMGDDGASSFQFLTGYDYPSGNYVFDGDVVSGLGFRGMPNPNITWYTVTTKNIGFDLDIHNGLLSAQVDLFQRDRSGLLARRNLTIPGTVGAELPQENLNEDMRRGIELVLGHAHGIGDFRYDISTNISYTRGQATKIERTPDANSYLNWRNNPTDRWDNITWGYNYIGQFQSQEEIHNSPIQDGEGNRTLRPGDLKYEDVNQDGIISSLDEVPIARSYIPEINYGLNLAAYWKNLDLSMQLQGAANFNLQYRGYLKSPLRWGRNTLSQFMDRWHREDLYDLNSSWVPGHFPSTNGPASNNWNSQFWWPDASYLRLKNLEIGYTFNRLFEETGIQTRLFASGFNLVTWTKVKFLDPEQNSDPYHPYPLMRVYNIGVNINF